MGASSPPTFPPEANARVGGYEVDLLWRERGLVVEVDAWATHGSLQAFQRDRRRDADLAAMGITVVRVPGELIDADIDEALRRVRGAYAAPAAAPAAEPRPQTPAS